MSEATETRRRMIGASPNESRAEPAVRREPQERPRRVSVTAATPQDAAETSADFVARSPVGMELLGRANQAASSDAPVLLTGPSGTGKTLLARHMHLRGARASGPFVTVNCGALPRELIESELFGHEKGAFTGAVNQRAGRIESAHTGTLFLDEIGELPLELQPKLLSVLQDRVICRVGSTQERQIDFRLVAATNRDLKEMVAAGDFREDLYYRLDVIRLRAPALMERQEDIVPIAKQILGQIAARSGQDRIELDEQASRSLESYQWPGNVRELQNALERAAVFASDGIVRAADLGIQVVTGREEAPRLPLAGMTLAEIEREAIVQTLKLVDGNRAAAARELGVSERTIYNKLKQLDL